MRLKDLNDSGFTLVEIVIVMVILGIIGAATFQMVAAGVESFTIAKARKELYDQGRLALERMVRELRDAKEVTGCSSNSITFKKAHPAQAADNIEEIKYQLNGTDLERVGDPSGTPLTAVLASNVTSFPVGPEGTTGLGVDAVSSGTTSNDTDISMTISHTTGSGSYRLMLVGISFNPNSDERLAAVDPVTYGGTPLSKVGERANSNDAMVYIYSLLSPTVGTADVVITFDSNLDKGAIAGVMTFTGVDQSTPLGTFASATGDNDTEASVIITSAADELVFGIVANEYDAITTAVTGQDVRWNTSTDFIDSDGPGTSGAGGTNSGTSPTMTWGLDVDSPVYNHWAMGGVSIKPAAPTDCSGTGVISFDAASSATSPNSPLTWSHTVGSGTNRLLVVPIGVEENATNGDVTSVTYNGVALTKAVENFVANFQNTEIWYLLDPPEGNANVVVTTNGDPDDINAGAISVFGADQSGPEATASNDDGETSATTIQTNIITLTDGAWVFDVFGSGEPRTFTPDAGQTERFDETGGTSGAAGSTEEVSTAGTATLGWTVDGTSNRISHVLAAFAPASQSIFPLVNLQLTLSSAKGGTVTLRTKVFMRNIPPT